MAVRAPVGLHAPAPAGERRAAHAVDRHHVVGVEAEPDHPVQPRAVEGGDDEAQRPHQVRRQVDVDLALQQRLADEPEVEVLQVAQAAVDELARARGGPGRVVGALDQRHAVAARGRVERDARAGDPAADDEHVERLGGERGDGCRARASTSCEATDVVEGQVKALWRFPVLGMRGESLRSSQIDTRGVGGRPPALRARAARAAERARPSAAVALAGDVPLQPRQRDGPRPPAAVPAARRPGAEDLALARPAALQRARARPRPHGRPRARPRAHARRDRLDRRARDARARRA